MEGILKGIRILDFGQFIAAPFCGMLLADMGAEVIKIERVGTGEDGRRLGPYKDGVSVYITAFNRNKKGITLDLHSGPGKKILEELIGKSDVIIENFRPGTMAKLGFDYETCKKINSRIIMSSISGFGQEGRYRNKAAMDGIASAMSGLHAINYTKTGPRPTGLPLGDHTAGVYNALAIVLALYDRERTGQGQRIDTAMLDCLFSFFETRLPGFAVNGTDIGVVPKYDTGDPLACPSNVYQCKDGWICIHAGADSNYKRFAAATGDEELIQEKYQKIENRMADYVTVDRLTAKWFAKHTVAEADEIMTEAGVPFGIVRNLEMILNDPNSIEREMVIYEEVPGAGKIPFVGNPLKLQTRPIKNRNRAPLLGEHNKEVLGGILGKTDQEIEKLKKEGVI